MHATADNVYGYPGRRLGRLSHHRLHAEKQGTRWKASGKLQPMTAKDGPHYADNVKMDGPGPTT